jgi:pyruvate kinase
LKKTKIVCTLGPASSSEAVLEKMLLAGMNVARLNFSHGDHEAHRNTIEKFRKVRDNLGLPAAVLLDTKGPEIRLGLFENDSVILENGQTFTLTPDEIMGNSERCSITYKKLATQVGAGTNILIDDGRVSLKVTELKGKDVICKVTHGGKISNRKGVNVPKTHLDLEYLSPTDKKDLLFGIEMDVDYIAASFVRTAEDVIDLRNFLDNNGGKKIKIISKIENIEGIENFSRILKHSNGIMVARGDMGVEVNYAKLPGLQKKLIKECRKAGKLVITATQMLESMVASPTPTRAEITGVANAVFDGTSAVMLSSESGMGK